MVPHLVPETNSQPTNNDATVAGKNPKHPIGTDAVSIIPYTRGAISPTAAWMTSSSLLYSSGFTGLTSAENKGTTAMTKKTPTNGTMSWFRNLAFLHLMLLGPFAGQRIETWDSCQPKKGSRL